MFKLTTLSKIILTSAVVCMASVVNAGAGESGHHHGHESSDEPKKVVSHHEAMGHQKQKNHHEMMSGHHGAMSVSGEPGKEKDVTQTINIDAEDAMRFTHSAFKIKEDETIKFVVTNKGAITHEFAIGTKSEHMAHGKMMMNNPGMHHGPGGNVISVKAGETQTLIWKFGKKGDFEAACNIPGHYQAGMHTNINVK